MLVEGAGGGCRNIFLPELFFVGTLIAWPEVAALDVAALRVFGMDAADADAGRANFAGVEAVDADAGRPSVTGVDAVDADRG